MAKKIMSTVRVEELWGGLEYIKAHSKQTPSNIFKYIQRILVHVPRDNLGKYMFYVSLEENHMNLKI